MPLTSTMSITATSAFMSISIMAPTGGAPTGAGATLTTLAIIGITCMALEKRTDAPNNALEGDPQQPEPKKKKAGGLIPALLTEMPIDVSLTVSTNTEGP